MTPRTDIVALPEDTTLADARSLVLEAGHSRIPIFRDSIDNVVGVMHERDLLRASGEQRDGEPVGTLARPVIFIPETLSVGELLSEMKNKKHFGLVVDEYGGVSGLVTLEDLLEEIVGEIQDEHDSEESLVRRQEDGSWLIDASTHVEELEERFGLSFEDRDFDTVGGLVVTGFGRVPSAGETTSPRPGCEGLLGEAKALSLDVEVDLSLVVEGEDSLQCSHPRGGQNRDLVEIHSVR